MSQEDTARAVKVTIYGNQYRVRGDADEKYIQGIADYVDQTMRSIAKGGHHISPTRIAILAAFNIADEMFRSSGVEEDGVVANPEDTGRLLKLFEGLEE
ncbi:MAG: cell division protein ZapA [Candidatus Krumholzibacteria bacterium]|jgi:cell division protein ZapA|nr:cell division protein ZapA [Candidatus Krumholzibacteria bacterium]MDP6669170.1 cell division protein ZapA [Candidatus Krumholzibacteria bacterium]MDP6797468.1 cell division protein ZapA [Candidatus Krumholzibacteria bacterium]MDP7020862.1 cell division protein ZapA [Candidatus Krumholzibacteria bacterium]